MIEAHKVKQILETYEHASGQSINYFKSGKKISKNTRQDNKDVVSNMLGVRVTLGTGKHLGLASMIGRNRKSTFKYIRDRVWKKLNSWSGRVLS